MKEKFYCVYEVQKECGDRLKRDERSLEAEGFLGTHKPDEISGYRGGYTPLERKQIEIR